MFFFFIELYHIFTFEPDAKIKDGFELDDFVWSKVLDAEALRDCFFNSPGLIRVSSYKQVEENLGQVHELALGQTVIIDNFEDLFIFLSG